MTPAERMLARLEQFVNALEGKSDKPVSEYKVRHVPTSGRGKSVDGTLVLRNDAEPVFVPKGDVN